MDANNINTGVSQPVDEFQWFKPTGGVHVEGVKISPPDFTIPPTPASSYSDLHVVLDTVHPSSQTFTSSVLPTANLIGRPYSGPSSFTAASSSFTPAPSSFFPSAPVIATRDAPISRSFDSSLYDNKLDDVPSTSYRAIPESVNPELPCARGYDALTSLKSEIAPMPSSPLPPMVPLDEFDDLAERTDRKLPESVDLSLTDESQRWTDEWNKVGDDIRHKNWDLHHYAPERDSYWAKQWNSVGQDIMNQRWNLRRFRPLPSSFEFNSWAMIDKLENAERQWRLSRGIDALWSGRMNRVHFELLNFVFPIGWSQWFSGLKNKLANKSSDLMSSASDLKYAAKDLVDAVEDEAIADYEVAKDSAKGFANKVADNLAADYQIAKDAAMDLANSVADTVSTDLALAKGAAKSIAYSVADSAIMAKDTAKNLANSASNAIADKVVDLTTTPLPKYDGLLWSEYEFYAPSFPRRAPADIIALEEKERADRLSRGINPVVSGMWHRLGREMLHSYRDDLADMFATFRLKLTRKGSDLVGSAKDALISLNNFKTPRELIATRGFGYEYETVNFKFARRVPYEIIELEEAERAYRIERGINPIVAGLWYRLGLELKYKFSIRPTLSSTASMVAGVAADYAGRAVERLSGFSDAVYEKSKELLAPAPVAEFSESRPLNLFAYSAEPIDFTFKSRRCPSWIKSLEEKERAERIAEGVNVLAYSKWNALLSEPHKTLSDAPSVAASVLPALNQAKESLSHAKESLVESGKGFSGMLGSWAHSVADKAASMIESAKHSQFVEGAKEFVHPDPSSMYSLNKAEETERARRMNEKVDPMLAARRGRVQEELLQSIKSV